jgi:hypothetical protein
MNTNWYFHMAWVVMAGVLGFAMAAICTRWFRLSRSWYLLPYVAFTGCFSYLYLQWSQLDLWKLVQTNWILGIVGACILGIFVVRNILSQPASAHSRGWQLAWDLIWLGGLYGFMDAVLLTVIPVVATWQAFSLMGWTASWPGQIIVGIFCWVASLLVAGIYHLGYVEYRGKPLIAPLIGNGVMTLGYLLTGNPIAALGSHIAMHVAGVLHGPETTAQLPPHYS